MKKILTGTILLLSLCLTGCDNNPPIYNKKISEIETMKTVDVNKQLNADEIYALYYIENVSSEPLGNKTVSEIIKSFESKTGTKVVKGEIKDFKDYKVRDLNISKASEQINKQATREEVVKIRKYVENEVVNTSIEQRQKVLNMTLGDILNNKDKDVSK